MAGLCGSRKARILVVDSDALQVERLREILEGAGCCHVRAVQPCEDLGLQVATYGPDLVVIDPKSDLSLLEAVQQGLPTDALVPILVFSRQGTPESRRHALKMGATDFLSKPGDRDEILLRIQNFLKMRAMHWELQERNRSLEEKVAERTLELEKSKAEILSRLAMASEWRDDDTGEHTKRVGTMASCIASELGWDPESARLLALAAPLHDLGKIGIPDSILLRANGLPNEEFEIMKTHTRIGADILSGSQSPFLEMAETIAISHHEWWDGKGYPHGFAGEDIPLCGRIVAVADVFDALRHDRPYKKAWPIEDAIAEIERSSGSHFDPQVVEAFLRVIRATARAHAA